MNDKVLGKYYCAGCGYRNDSEQEILKHILQYHPNLKSDLRNRYDSMRGL